MKDEKKMRQLYHRLFRIAVERKYDQTENQFFYHSYNGMSCYKVPIKKCTRLFDNGNQFLSPASIVL